MSDTLFTRTEREHLPAPFQPPESANEILQ